MPEVAKCSRLRGQGVTVANNLFVSFELHDFERQGALVLGAIEELGRTVQISGSICYVRSDLSAGEAATRVQGVLGDRDRLLIVNTSDNEAAMLNLDERASRFIAEHWHLDLFSSLRERNRATPAAALENETQAPCEAVG
jgi:hypothetical protein